MSKVFKGVKKAVKKVVKGVKKVFKKVWESPLGKILLIAAAIYTGGVALGAWGGPGWMSAIAPAAQTGGAAAGGAAAGTAGAIAPVSAAQMLTAPGLTYTGAGITGGAPAAIGGGAGVAGGGAAVGGGAAAGGGLVAGAAPAAAAPASVSGMMSAPGLTAGYSGAGIGAGKTAGGIVEMVRGLGRFANQYPMPAAMAVSGLASALSPSEAEEQGKYDERLRRERDRNLLIGNVGIGFSPSGQQAQRMSGGPLWQPDGGGLVRSRMAGGGA